MSRNDVVAVVTDGDRIVIKPDKCPLYLLRCDDVEGWLIRRAIDAHRTNSRLLRKALRLAPNDDLAAVMRVHGATVTDTYWYCDEHEKLDYEQVRFKDNDFADLALRGDPDSFQRGNEKSRTPELTNVGSFEKCWKRLDNAWWMFKAGNELEQFSEIFAYHFGKLLGLNMAEYVRDAGYVRTQDFTHGDFNFEPLYSLVGDDEDYRKNYLTIREYSAKAAVEYVGMVYFDALILNMDRHTNNYGLLREPETGECVSLAPLFDHNISLVSRGYPNKPERRKDLLQSLFVDFLKDEPQVVSDFRSLGLQRPTPAIISQAILATKPSEFSEGIVQEDFLQKFILSAQEWMEEQIPQLY